MDLLYLGAAVLLGLSAFGLLRLCEYLFRDDRGGRS